MQWLLYINKFYYFFQFPIIGIIIRYGTRRILAISHLIVISPTASWIQLSSVPAKAILKNNIVSTIDPIIEPTQGAFHQDCFRKKLKKVISSIWLAIKATPDAIAIRQSAKYQDASTAIGKLIHATCRARVGPSERFERSITRYTSGKLKAPQVSQSLIGIETRIFDITMTNVIANIAERNRYFDDFIIGNQIIPIL